MELKINEPWITIKVRYQNSNAYIDKTFQNAEKQCADHKCEYIGKYASKVFTPNKTFHSLKAEYKQSLVAHPRRAMIAENNNHLYQAYLMK